MKRLKIAVVRDFDNLYYANVFLDDEQINDLPEYVSYRELKKAIKGKINYDLPVLKNLRFYKYGRKYYANIGWSENIYIESAA